MAVRVTLGDIPVHVVRKNIKNIHLRISEPSHEVQISVPRHMPIETAQALAMTKFDWLTRRLAELRAHHPQPYLTGFARTSCYLWGERVAIRYVEVANAPRVEFDGTTVTIAHREGATAEKIDAQLEAWYRTQLAEQLQPIRAQWEHTMGVAAQRVSLQRMKTRWGSSNNATRMIRINVEMAKRPLAHLEYLYVHELTHFFHNGHGTGFQGAMDHWLPGWRELQHALDIFPRD